MKKHSSFYFGVLAVLLAVAMLATTLITAGATTSAIPQSEIDAIVNTTTDASQVTSPFIEVANQVRSSVVGVNNYTTRSSSYYGFGYGYGNRQQSQETKQGFGSGVVITSYGHILTNYHVIEDSTRVTVTTDQDDQEHAATVVGYDADLDIAVLYAPDINLKPVPLGDSDQLQVGEWAIVVGNPLGEKFARTMTVGVISALDRQVQDRTYDRYGRRTTITNTMIQVDAAINSGNSGGGLFNTLGQLQGIPERKYTSGATLYQADVDNIGMCIPINVAKPLIEQVLREFNPNDAQASADNQNGNKNAQGELLIGRPRLGVTVTSFVNSNNLLPNGAVVKNVEPNSPAAQGGVKEGDIIVECDGVVISSYTDLTSKIREYNEGDTVKLKVWRDEGLASQINQNSIDLSKVGEGEYIDLSVTLRVIDDQNM